MEKIPEIPRFGVDKPAELWYNGTYEITMAPPADDWTLFVGYFAVHGICTSCDSPFEPDFDDQEVCFDCASSPECPDYYSERLEYGCWLLEQGGDRDE